MGTIFGSGKLSKVLLLEKNVLLDFQSKPIEGFLIERFRFN